MAVDRKVVVLKLTRAEARALAQVAGNGWGDGDFAEYLGDNKRAIAATKRALTKLDRAAFGEPK
jgi:hypothetical protein